MKAIVYTKHGSHRMRKELKERLNERNIPYDAAISFVAACFVLMTVLAYSAYLYRPFGD